MGKQNTHIFAASACLQHLTLAIRTKILFACLLFSRSVSTYLAHHPLSPSLSPTLSLSLSVSLSLFLSPPPLYHCFPFTNLPSSHIKSFHKTRPLPLPSSHTQIHTKVTRPGSSCRLNSSLAKQAIFFVAPIQFVTML